MANRDRHRRFGNVRRRESGRYQIRYPGPDGRMRTGPETYERKSDADRALVLIEAQIDAGEWTDPERGKVKLGDYVRAGSPNGPELRPRTMDLYRWLLKSTLSLTSAACRSGSCRPVMVREWRATLLANGVSVSVAAKAYRLLRAIMTTAVEEDKILPGTRAGSAAPGRGRSRTAGPDRSPGLRAGRAGGPPTGRQHPQDSAAATGSASAVTARCARLRRCTPAGPRPNEPCGRWLATAGPTATMTGGSAP